MLDVTKIEVKLHGRWIGLPELPEHSCLDAVTTVTEDTRGYLEVTSGDTVTTFRPVEWRTIEDE